MIDELFKHRIDLFWDRVGTAVARTGFTANGVTLTSVALSALNALLFPWHRHFFLFALLVALIELLDNVDGAVARVTKSQSRLGAYLDATTDRYKDSFILLAIAWTTGYWAACMLALAGSLITSYNHARAAMLGAEAAGGPPDLFERFERITTLCIGLALAALFPGEIALGHDLLFFALWFVAGMTHLTAVQRLARRARQLREIDRRA